MTTDHLMVATITGQSSSAEHFWCFKG